MAYTPHLLVQFGGKLLGPPDDIWTCSIRGESSGALSAFNPNGYLANLHDGLATWYSANTTHMATTATLAFVKCNRIAADGSYADVGETNVWDYPTPGVGSDIPRAPAFCSQAMTWRTPRARGRASHGRIYPPNYTSVAVGSKVGDAETLNTAHAAHALILLLGSVNDGGSGTFAPSVYSKLDGSHEFITHTQAGNIYDVIRKRKNAYREVYTSGD